MSLTEESSRPWLAAGMNRSQWYAAIREGKRVENINRFTPPPPKPLNRKQREAWAEINQLIQDNAGAVVSKSMEEPVRFECDVNSDLPEVLRYAGFATVPDGTTERLWPQTINGVTHVAPIKVAVFRLRLLSVEDVFKS